MTWIKHLLSSFLILLSIQSWSQLTEAELADQHQKIEAFRTNLEAEFRDPEESPIEDDSIPFFKGLEFFPINDAFIFKAKFELIEDGEIFEMKTTTARLPVYKDFGLLKFEHEGKPFTLHIYQNIELSKKEGYEDYLFLPFNDFTNGIESYGGGRYIDLRIPKDEEVILDFNLSYNPYCAYNHKYSCPVPPEENKLDFRIEAGIRKYH